MVDDTMETYNIKNIIFHILKRYSEPVPMSTIKRHVFKEIGEKYEYGGNVDTKIHQCIWDFISDGEVERSAEGFKLTEKPLPSLEEYIERTPIDVADPIGYAAEEYWCAMKVLDDLKVPREKYGVELSLVGRIKHLALTSS